MSLRMAAIGMCALWAFLGHAGDVSRDGVLGAARAYWHLGDGGAAGGLTRHGSMALHVPAEGPGARAGSLVARMQEGYFDAGKTLGVQGSGITAYVRARDPEGRWAYALFNKRGGHEMVNFNLFSVDLGGTPGPDIGFEVHTDQGFVMVSFPVSAIDATAWHDFAGRYDGNAIEVICDGRVMAKRMWRGGALTQNGEPVLIGAETDHGAVVRPFTGEMEAAGLWDRALSDGELAAVMGKEQIMPDTAFAEPYASPIHYRPAAGRLADTIPFFWKGEYHIFYLRAIDKVPWEHLSSKDLIHWEELPTALRADGAADGPDGLHMFTGSVTEHNGTFHIFYTGWNPDNKAGREKIMHATSPDLITWTKHPEDGFYGDGIHYQNSDFRDPYVFWNESAQAFWMVLCARDASSGHPVQGLAESKDLMHWEQMAPLTLEPALGEGTPECPDLFNIGGTWYLLNSPCAGTTDMRYSGAIRGPYRIPETASIDTPILYAAKRMFDGQRHIITGWIRDLEGEKDKGGFMWGGDQSVPREVYPGSGGVLFFRPVPEAVNVFARSLDSGRLDQPVTLGKNEVHGFETPDNYLLTAEVRLLEPDAEVTLAMRVGNGSGYRLILRPGKQEGEISGAAFRYARHVTIDVSKPITIQAFVQGSIIECFINDAYPFSCRAYDCREGNARFEAEGGVTIERMSIAVAEVM